MRLFDAIGKVFRDIRGFRDGSIAVEPRPVALLDGRMFRTVFDFNIANGATQVVRIDSPIDFVLRSQEFSLDSGSITFEACTGGTESGAWATPVPVFGMNRTAYRTLPLYVPQIAITTGGTHVGGTIVELIRLAAAQQSSSRQTVGKSLADSRILPAGKYYLRFRATSAAVGIHNIIIEEIPA